MRALLVFFCLVAGTFVDSFIQPELHPAPLYPGPCPKISGKPVKLKCMSGAWYELERSENNYDNFDECQKLFWKKPCNDSAFVVYSSASVLAPVTSTMMSQVVHSKRGLQVTYLLPVVGKLYAERIFLDVNYKNYVISYSCENVGNKHREMSWVYGRNPEMTPTIEAAKRRAFEKYNLPLPEMVPRDYTNCTEAFCSYKYLN